MTTGETALDDVASSAACSWCLGQQREEVQLQLQLLQAGAAGAGAADERVYDYDGALEL